MSEAQCIWSFTPCPILSFFGALRYNWVCIRAVTHSPALNLSSWKLLKGDGCHNVYPQARCPLHGVAELFNTFRRELLHWAYWDVLELTNLQKGKENFPIQARDLNFLRRTCWWFRCPPEGAGFDPKDGLPAWVVHWLPFFSSQDFRTQF